MGYYDPPEYPEPHCCDCVHYLKGKCYREDEDENEYTVDVDDDVCERFEARERDPYDEPDTFDYYEYREKKRRCNIESLDYECRDDYEYLEEMRLT